MSHPIHIPLVDLKEQYKAICDEIDAAIKSVVDSCAFVRGPEVRRFEEEFASFCGVPYAVGVANGTDALILALKALGVGPGDEVIVPSFTFVATAGCVYHVGAELVLADVNEEDFTIDPNSVQEKLTERTRAIIPVHLFGHPADMDEICGIAEKRRIFVLEDSAQSHGAFYKDRMAGTIGHAATFSFYPGKNLGAYGDGGMVITRDEELAARVRLLGNHGSTDKYNHSLPGFNSRLDSIQAAVLRVKLHHLNSWTAARSERAGKYRALLESVDGVTFQKSKPWARHVFHLFVIRIQSRDRILRALRSKGIGAQVHYPICIHEQEGYASAHYPKGSLPVAEKLAREVISLPLYPELGDYLLEEVVNTLKEELVS